MTDDTMMTPAGERLIPDNAARCYEVHAWMGHTFVCDRPLDHDGDHGSGPMLTYSLTWPGTCSSCGHPAHDPPCVRVVSDERPILCGCEGARA